MPGLTPQQAWEAELDALDEQARANTQRAGRPWRPPPPWLRWLWTQQSTLHAARASELAKWMAPRGRVPLVMLPLKPFHGGRPARVPAPAEADELPPHWRWLMGNDRAWLWFHDHNSHTEGRGPLPTPVVFCKGGQLLQRIVHDDDICSDSRWQVLTADGMYLRLSFGELHYDVALEHPSTQYEAEPPKFTVRARYERAHPHAGEEPPEHGPTVAYLLRGVPFGSWVCDLGGTWDE